MILREFCLMIRGCFAADDLAGFTSPGRRNFNGLFFLCYAGCFVLTRGVAGYSIFDFCRLVAFLSLTEARRGGYTYGLQ